MMTGNTQIMKKLNRGPSNPESPFKIGELILYKNNQLIAFNKPAGIAVQEDKTGDKALINLVEIYCKCPIHLIHRLDRPASGVVIFAKNKKALAAVNEQFRNREVKKTYLAVVGNLPPEKEGKIVHYLGKDQEKNRAIVYEKESPQSKRAALSYRLIGSIDNYHLLEISLLTGRHHQIRAQLAALGCPVKGDVKYGFKRGNKDRSIHLHAWKLSFRHPVSNEVVEVTAPVPEETVWKAFGKMPHS